jgi:hypothetical protein
MLRTRRREQHIIVVSGLSFCPLATLFIFLFMPAFIGTRAVTGESEHAHYHSADLLSNGQP